MFFLKRLFGGKAAQRSDAAGETYNGYLITPTPQPAGSQYRICARIEREVGGELRSHSLIRVDTLGDLKDAAAASIAKAKQVIDEQGDDIFK